MTITTTSPSIQAYRPDIDGLRALAVLSVIIFHFNEQYLPGGYLGVDIFFVISGYVITASICGRNNERLSEFLVGFYSRRAKRILPALIFCVLAGAVLISLLSATANDSLKAGLAALFGFSNLYFLKANSDYFGSTPELNIFTHTWSLGVEEQFYLIYPLLFWVFFSVRQREKTGRFSLSLVLILFGLCSLCAYILLSLHEPIASFYLIFTRFWELAAGCIAFITLRPWFIKYSNKKTTYIFRPELALTGLIAILFVPSSHIIWATVASVLFTTLLITLNHSESTVYRLLSQKHIVYIGLISYSLYLWHWLVLCISHWTVGVSIRTILVQLTLIFLFAILSFHLVEKPLRKSVWNLSAFKTLFIGLSSSIAASLFIVGIYLSGGLYLGKEYPIPRNQCSSNLDTGYWISGDSHAGIYSSLFNEIIGNECTLMIDHSATGNSFLFSRNSVFGAYDTNNQKPKIDVALTNPDEFIELLDKYSPKILFIAVYWNGYFLPNELHHQSSSWTINKYRSEEGKEITLEQAVNDYLININKVASTTKGKTKFIILMPEPDFNWTTFGVRSGECEPQWFNLGSYPSPLEEICNKYRSPAITSLQQHRIRTGSLENAIFNALSDAENIYFFDITQLVCNNEFCSTHDNGIRLYMDDDHLGYHGLELIKPTLTELLHKIQG